ncbi:uncharacterized protein LOC120476330 [Pimephales promelas]|uniref:uncharacterized protein LOC120476330 n=1 Tax=Pimephales promelas TaxID=90988 RepID=UPI0019557377|nr:uncharacterized protein LOC120476330 [Pimephales promelas]
MRLRCLPRGGGSSCGLGVPVMTLESPSGVPDSVSSSNHEEFRKAHWLHLSILQSSQKPQPTRCFEQGCQFLHCPFCPHYKGDYSKVETHLQSHLKTVVQHGEFVMYICKWGCRKESHYHCCACIQIFQRKKQLLRHLSTCHPRPAEGHPRPAESHPRPAEDHPRPAEGHPRPAEGHPRPAEDHPRPAEDHPRPAEGHTRPAEGHPRPAEGHTRPAEGHPRPAEDHPRPAEGHPRPAEGPLSCMEAMVEARLHPVEAMVELHQPKKTVGLRSRVRKVKCLDQLLKPALFFLPSFQSL